MNHSDCRHKAMVLNMKRNKIIEALSQEKLVEHKQRIAFHEAGHAAGIHLNNKARQLPPIFFKIIFKDMGAVTDAEAMAYQTTHDDCIARVEGGRLIESLPLSIDSLVRELTLHNDAMTELLDDYMKAFEADVINLLVGPLAEAKHVAENDGELFNPKIVNLEALKNYGGSSDLAMVNEYLQSFSDNQQQREEKLDQLFTIAFNFVNDQANWTAITKLANHILSDSKNIIGCEEIVSMIDESIDHYQNRRVVAGSQYDG
jgi:predicted transposase YbfD/YdcC